MRFYGFVRASVLVMGGALALAGCSVDGNGLPSSSHGDAGPADSTRVSTGGRGAGGEMPIGSGGSESIGTGGVSGSGGGGGLDGDSTGGGTGTGGTQGTGGAAGSPGSGGSSQTGGKGGTGTGGGVSTGGTSETGGRAAGGRGGSGGDGGAGGRGGQPGGCGPSTCRNGCCDGNTCITANRNRQFCGNGGIACATCAPCFQCSNAGTCDLDPSSNWAISCQSATLTATRANGVPWDAVSTGAAGAEPDPFCEFQLRDIGQRDTTVVMNTRTPVWNQTITPRDSRLTANWLISHPGEWSIVVADYDGMDNEAACQVFPTVAPPSFSTGTLVFRSMDSCTSLTLQLICDE